MIFDIIVLGVLLVSAIIAFLRGFIREVLTIMGVVGGAAAAFAFGGKFSPVMLGWLTADTPAGEEPKDIFGVVPPELMADVLAYGAIFVVVVLALSIISHFMSGWARAIGLGAVDRSFGALFGIVRGAVIITLVYLPVFLIFEKPTRASWFEGSKTNQYVESAAGWAAQFVPENATEDLKKKAEEKTEQVAEDARERLLNIDGLRQEESAPADGAESGTGYEQQQRRDMNELMLDNADDTPPAYPAPADPAAPQPTPQQGAPAQ